MAKSTNYDVANQFCKNQGAHLFEPRSEITNKLVFDKSVEVFGGAHKSWIGINDIVTEGEFIFESSGEKVNLFFWDSGNGPGDNDDCVLFGHANKNNEKWYDRPCTEQSYSICESEHLETIEDIKADILINAANITDNENSIAAFAESNSEDIATINLEIENINGSMANNAADIKTNKNAIDILTGNT